MRISYFTWLYLLVGLGAENVKCGFLLKEGAQIALEAGQSLLPDSNLVQKVTSDVAAIRKTFDKEVGDIMHQRKWVAGQLIFYESTKTPANTEKLARLNGSRFGPIKINQTSMKPEASRIDFTRPYQPRILSVLIKEQFGLMMIPNSFIGRSMIINYNKFLKEYTFSRGSGDCQAGCTKWERYLFVEDSKGTFHLHWTTQSPATERLV